MSNAIPMSIKENRKKFIKALRSNEYHQGFGQYHEREEDDDGNSTDYYCAIGVCFMSLDKEDLMFNMATYDQVAEMLYIQESDVEEIIEMNDDKEMSFGEIADRLVGQCFLEDKDYREIYFLFD